MYICDDKKLIFIHIPKTGGSAIREMMKDLGLTRYGERHNGLSVLENPEQYRDYFIFTIVRNPYQRLISMYRFHLLYRDLDPDKHVRRWGTLDTDKTDLRSFRDFVRNRSENRIPILQSDFIWHDFLKVKAYKYEEGAHEQIRNRFGLETAPKDEAVNYLGGYDNQDWSDAEGINMITDICREDIERFGYGVQHG